MEREAGEFAQSACVGRAWPLLMFQAVGYRRDEPALLGLFTASQGA